MQGGASSHKVQDINPPVWSSCPIPLCLGMVATLLDIGGHQAWGIYKVGQAGLFFPKQRLRLRGSYLLCKELGLQTGFSHRRLGP